MPYVKIEIGPDDQEPGIAYGVTGTDNQGEWDSFDSGGWNGSGPRRSSDPDAWFALAKRRLRLPRPVRAAGLTWEDADVRPYGWSQGRGHAPQGITITWSWGRERNRSRHR